ncbi:hypothetical protein LQU94_03380 [Peptoniphilus sp. KCTC 25270]|uniref:hypothetical protein n=1 Tax=Peptoniphilus sp. KCTC 25270 TaxID=2897414 RepID=UPI001E62F3E0|nr:hypothetical protein [Peptoniphilus sp. KCTC 25270]MCD1147157.1 hypothetical protein [Peptoniphilus sp. KCTC 25270]
MKISFDTFKNKLKKEKPSLSETEIDENIIERFKNKRQKKSDEILAGALVLVSCGLLGYYGFINGPMEQKESILLALSADSHVAQAKEEDGFTEVKSDKPLFLESEVQNAVMNLISNDPYALIVGEQFQNSQGAEGGVTLTVEYSGAPGELSQFLQGIQNSEKTMAISDMNYQKDLDGKELTTLSVQIPYTFVDHTLASGSFVAADVAAAPAAPAPITAPPTTATPASKIIKAPKTVVKTITPKSSSSTNVTKPKVPVTPTKPTPAPKPQKPEEPKGPLVKPASTTPERKPDTQYNAQPILTYGMPDSISGVNSLDGLAVKMTNSNGIAGLGVAEKWVQLNFSTPPTPMVQGPKQVIINPEDENAGYIEVPGEMVPGNRETVNREIQLNTGGIYLPKNGYELSIDVSNHSVTQGKFQLLIADQLGNTTIVEESRRTGGGEGYDRIFFSLKGMDGTKRATQFRYLFVDSQEVQEEIVLKNFQILSHEV